MAGGTAAFVYEDSAGGTPTLTASEAANPTAVFATQPETVNPGVAASITFSAGSPTTVNAGQQSGLFTITVDDSTPAPVANELINLSSTSGTGVFYNSAGTTVITSVITNSSGQAFFLYEDPTAGAPTLTAADAAKPATAFATQNVTVGPGVVNTVTFTTPDATTTNEGQQSGTITIQAKDSGGAAVRGEVINLSSTSPTGVFYNSAGTAVITTVVTGAGGTASFLYEDPTTGTPTLTATDKASGMSGTQMETVNPGASITFGPAVTVSTGKQSGPITITVTDANGNPVANEEVDLKSSSTGGTFYTTGGVALPTEGGVPYVVTNASGQAFFLYADSFQGTPTLTAAVAAVNSVFKTQQETITPGAAFKIAFGSAVSVSAGKQSGPISITVTNSTNAPVVGEIVDLSTSSPTTGTFYTTGGAALPTTAGGVPYVVTGAGGTASFLYEDTALGLPTPTMPTLTATDSAFTTSKSQQETIIVGAATSIALSGVTSADPGVESGPITVQVKNTTNTGIVGELVELSSSSTSGIFLDANGNIITSVITGAGGNATFYYLDTSPGAGPDGGRRRQAHHRVRHADRDDHLQRHPHRCRRPAEPRLRQHNHLHQRRRHRRLRRRGPAEPARRRHRRPGRGGGGDLHGRERRIRRQHRRRHSQRRQDADVDARANLRTRRRRHLRHDLRRPESGSAAAGS